MVFPALFLKQSNYLYGQQSNRDRFVLWEHHWGPNGAPGIYCKWRGDGHDLHAGESWGHFTIDGQWEKWETITDDNRHKFSWIWSSHPNLDISGDFDLAELEQAQSFLKEGA